MGILDFFLLSKKKEIRAGLSFGEEGGVKSALVAKTKEGWEVLSLEEGVVSCDMRVKPLYTVAVPLRETLFRKISLPTSSKRKGLALLPFQLESLLPYPSEEAIVVPLLKKEGKRELTAHLFCTREKSLQAVLALAKEEGIDPTTATMEPLALYRLIRTLLPQLEEALILYCGEQRCCCLYIQHKEILICHTLLVGKKDSEQKLRMECKRLASFLREKEILPEKIPSLCLGYTEPFSSLWQEAFPSPEISLEKPFGLEPAVFAQYTLPIGLALHAFETDLYTTQLRQGMWESPTARQKRRKNLFRTGLLGLFVVLLCSGGAHLVLEKKRSSLTQQLQVYLPGKDLSSSSKVAEAVAVWERSLSSEKNSQAFFCTAPSVSDLLAWLSTHPSLNTPEGLPKEGVVIRSVRYSLDQYPSLGEGSGIYLARVEIEFFSKIPRIAREFHEALLAGDPIVNTKKEIQWTSHQNVYSTSFELRDRKKITVTLLEGKNHASAHKVEADVFGARPRSRMVCEKSIAKALWQAVKTGESTGHSPKASPQLYECLQNHSSPDDFSLQSLNRRVR